MLLCVQAELYEQVSSMVHVNYSFLNIEFLHSFGTPNKQANNNVD